MTVTDILATGFGAREHRVLDVASTIADVLDVTVRRVDPDTRGEREIAADAVLNELSAPGTILGVIPARRDHRALCWQVIERSTKPIVLVPRLVRPGRRPIRRALVPLDGTSESAVAVQDTIALMANAGVEVLVLHVFVEATTPRYWDQPAHAQRAWQQEFLTRYCITPGVRMEVRSGLPQERVVNVAVDADADLIALAWSQRLGGGRAAVVRQAALSATVPVLLLPVAGQASRTPPA